MPIEAVWEYIPGIEWRRGAVRVCCFPGKQLVFRGNDGFCKHACMHACIRPYQWHLVSGYGLFRRMTGLGIKRQVLHNSGGKALPTVSARPELVIDASDDGRTRQ